MIAISKRMQYAAAARREAGKKNQRASTLEMTHNNTREIVGRAVCG
ncbi:hypothetical protein [Serratia rubidaea]|nr:hypothetical protein [Serratia rubidaea]MBD8452259.1 hypothetical protein [Serratia rubidaea]WBF46841.1 hypothetical protein OLD77_07260 [Serratia rubidaea]